MAGFRKAKEEFVDFKTMNKALKYVKSCRRILFRQRERGENIGFNAFIEDDLVRLKLTYKVGSTLRVLIFRKDNCKEQQKITGMEAFRILSKYYKVPRFKIQLFSASPLLWKNDKYEGKRVYAYAYDMNSAYAFGMLQDIPDTSTKSVAKIVESDEIGFDLDGNFVKTGEYGYFVFKKMKSPFIKFVEKWYKNKQDPELKQKAKNVLTFSVGYLQKVNCFLRATIINYCNNYILNLLDENSIYCNTDSIVSLKERPDLKIGTNLGEFKLEHTGVFAYCGFNYQWYGDTVAYRGVPKSWFKKGFDITTDAIPDNGNIYKLNKINLQLTKRKLKKELVF